MKFKMNNRDWEIIELSQDKMRETFAKYDEPSKNGRYFGLTYVDNDKIYLDKDLCLDQKKQTLKHELMHCYIACYLFNSGEKQFDEEDLCNISSNSHEIIHDIYSRYFKTETTTSINKNRRRVKINDND